TPTVKADSLMRHPGRQSLPRCDTGLCPVAHMRARWLEARRGCARVARYFSASLPQAMQKCLSIQARRDLQRAQQPENHAMSQAMHPVLQFLNRTSLVTQIIIGLLAGIALAVAAPQAALSVAFIGNVFVSALKAVAPVLVFILVMSSIEIGRASCRERGWWRGG